MTWIDWALVAAVYLLVVGSAWYSRRYMEGVADFLAAGRTAGRYLISVASGIAGLGAITIVANLQMNYEAGFAMGWWGMSMALFGLIVAVTGWVNYRFRATRCLTLAEFFERRYSRRFRIFAGLVAFSAGLVNFGIFPSVGARFFIYYLGLPEQFGFLGLQISAYPVLMAVLLATAVFSVFIGGQVSVIVSDFIQGLFTNIVFVVMLVYVIARIGWGDISEILIQQSPPGKSLINPFDTGNIPDFNFVYFAIGVIGLFYGAMSWQGTQAYNTSAKSAHEAKMGIVLGNWRGLPQSIFVTVIPIIMMTLYFHPDWAGLRNRAEAVIGTIASPEVQSQMRVPIMLAELLPVGLLGAFAAVMLACFISTHNTYLHSWGSIFIQDVVLPFRREPLSQRQHISLLRWSIIGVSVFIFMFSLLYRQTEAILLFFAVTGAIFAGGSGAVIIGGLYTRWGNTAAAWTALCASVVIALGGMVLQLISNSTGAEFALNGQEIWGIGMPACAGLYLAVSLIFRSKPFDIAALTARSIHDELDPATAARGRPPLWQRVFAITSEFTLHDKLIYLLSYGWTFGWVAVFVIGTTLNFWSGQTESANDRWISFWQVYVAIYLVASVLVLVWFTIGGLRDLKMMFNRLSVMTRDSQDTGVVQAEK